MNYDTYPLVMKVIDLVGEGKTESSACDQVCLSVRVFRSAVKNNEELQELYDEALQRGYDRMAEALVEIDSNAQYGVSDPKMARVISDNIKWLLEKRKPKDYGQRVDHNINITADHAVVEALSRGRERALTGRVIDATAIDVTPKQITAPPLLDEEAVFLNSIGAGEPITI